jgi:hypothetical protein
MSSSCTESYKKDPEPPIDPLSKIFKPANLIAGFAVLRFMIFDPIFTADAVMFSSEDDP